MRQSELFTKTRKEAPKGEVARNAQLLIRAGYIHKEMAGVYSYLPLGLKVFNNIARIIREEMDAIKGQEIKMTALQSEELWCMTDRWDDEKVDNWFKTKLKSGTELGLGFTHEEPLTRIMSDHISSYRDLPVLTYQIQTKFRNELRSKSGLMRGREFSMKDMYSFAKTKKEHEELYAKVREAYKKIFERVGIGDRTLITFASGGVFSKYSEEFQTLCESGEDVIYVDEKKGIAVNKEVLNDEVLADLGLDRNALVEKKAIETGNIFSLGTRFSEPLKLTYKDEKEQDKPVVMGSYGIGVGRVMGVLAEILSDEKGLVWPEAVAPFKVHLVSIGADEKVREYAEEVYKGLLENDIKVLYDDRDLRAGQKFSDADLMGLPLRAVISETTMTEGKIEITNRATGKTSMIDEADVYKL